MSWVDFIVRILCAQLLGGAIGAERQWRQRMAGLRTNALVATGAALFVSLGVMIPGPSDSSRIISYVVSGIGFLGGGVILREGFTVRGLNTAATLWCSAAVGCMTGSGFLAQAAVAALFVIAANVLFRPLAAIIDRQPLDNAEVHTHYVCSVICRGDDEAFVRASLLRALSNPAITLQALDSNDLEDTDKVRVRARLVLSPRNDALLEQVVSQLSLDPTVSAVRWRTVEEDHPLDLRLSTKEQAE
jgi:putative Mg2+ transporter-C (MgtC) family protein